MQNENVELTLLGDKERLSYVVERAQNIFKVVAQNYDNDVITLVDDIDLAIKYPLKVSGWDHEWELDEQSKLEDPYEKCIKTREIVNNAKKATSYLLESLTKLYEELYNLSILADNIEDYVSKFDKLILDSNSKIASLQIKKQLSSQESSWCEEIKRNIMLLEDSHKALEIVKPSIKQQQDELVSNIKNLSDFFLTDEIPAEKIYLQQEVTSLINIVNILYSGVKGTYLRQSEIIDDLGKFFYAMSERCNEFTDVMQSMLNSSQDLCDKSEKLLSHKPLK